MSRGVGNDDSEALSAITILNENIQFANCQYALFLLYLISLKKEVDLKKSFSLHSTVNIFLKEEDDDFNSDDETDDENEEDQVGSNLEFMQYFLDSMPSHISSNRSALKSLIDKKKLKLKCKSFFLNDPDLTKVIESSEFVQSELRFRPDINRPSEYKIFLLDGKLFVFADLDLVLEIDLKNSFSSKSQLLRYQKQHHKPKAVQYATPKQRSIYDIESDTDESDGHEFNDSDSDKDRKSQKMKTSRPNQPSKNEDNEYVFPSIINIYITKRY